MANPAVTRIEINESMKLANRETCDKIFQIIGKSYDVINYYHRGLQESAYHAALAWEMRQLPYHVQLEECFHQYYKGVKLDKTYRMDLVVDDILVELKAKECITSEHRLQLFNYMRLVNMTYGLLINFGVDHVDAERYYYDQKSNKILLIDKDGNQVYSDK